MARPRKRGLVYFPKDVDFYDDPKIVRLSVKYGPIGLTTFEVLLTMIYREGYFIKLSASDAALNVVRKVGDRWYMKNGMCPIDFAAEIILYCAEIGLLNESLVKQGVMTSVGIQRRYAAATVKNKVKITDYRLLDENGSPIAWESAPTKRVISEETRVSAEETPVSAEEMQQRKLNKSKGKLKERPDSVSATETSKTQSSGQTASGVDADNNKIGFVIKEYERLLPMLTAPGLTAKLIANLAKAERSREDYTHLFELASQSSFLTSPKGTWACTIEWLTEPDNMGKVLSGKYSDYTSPKKSGKLCGNEIINGVESGFDTEDFFKAALARENEK